jgi:hypothetical protein
MVDDSVYQMCDAFSSRSEVLEIYEALLTYQRTWFEDGSDPAAAQRLQFERICHDEVHEETRKGSEVIISSWRWERQLVLSLPDVLPKRTALEHEPPNQSSWYDTSHRGICYRPTDRREA